MADSILTGPSRRATLLGTAGLATVVVSGTAEASPISPAVQKAFDAWQKADAAYWHVQTTIVDPAMKRYHGILPDRRPGAKDFGKVATTEDRVAIDAAYEMSGLNAADEAADAALDETLQAFRCFIKTPPQTIEDIRLQAKHLAKWNEDSEVAPTILDWLEVLIGGGVA